MELSGSRNEILLQLELPEIAPRSEETWQDHRLRLLREKRQNRGGPTYDVNHQLINCADYGVPQSRERVLRARTICSVDAGTGPDIGPYRQSR